MSRQIEGQKSARSSPPGPESHVTHSIEPLPPVLGPTAPLVRGGALRTILGLWLRPIARGPSAACRGWGISVAVHLGGLVICGLLISFFRFREENLPGIFYRTLADQLRLWALEELVPRLGGASGGGRAWLEAGAWLASYVGVGLLIAFCLLGWMAAGDSLRRAATRAIKLTWWGSSFLVLLGAGLLAGSFVAEWLWFDPAPRRTFDPGDRRELIYLLVLAVWVVGQAVVLLLAGLRHPGPVEGPGAEPIEVTCEECGYSLLKLSPDGVCPECGTAVRESLPGGQHPAGVWERSRQSPLSIGPFYKTLMAALFSAGFYRHVPVRGGHGAARRFLVSSWLHLWIVCTAITAVPIVFFGSPVPQHLALYLLWVPVVLAGWLAVLMWAAASIPGVSAMWHGKVRDLRVSATVAMYATSHLWAVAIFNVLVGVVGIQLSDLDTKPVDRVIHGILITDDVVLFACAFVYVTINLALGLWWVVRVRDALRAAARSNA